MTDRFFAGYMPANARVLVNYKRGEKVGFSYPTKWTYQQAVWKRAYPTVVQWWVGLHIFPFGFVAPFILFAGIAVSIYRYFNPLTIIYGSRIESYHGQDILFPLLGFFYLLGIPAVITWLLSLNKKKMAYWLPKIGKWSAGLSGVKKTHIFTLKEIRNKQAVIPCFSNVYLDYNAKKDFSRYLDSIEICELPFMITLRNDWWWFKKEKNKNDFYFYAVFTFSKQPKKGSLHVEFK